MYAIMNAPELEWLKGNVNGTPEGESVSEMEFKRTKLSLDLLKWVLEGDYEHFTECQSDDVKLTKKSFAEIQQYTRGTLKTNADEYAMQAYLVINDLGKIVSFVEQIERELKLQSVDHDEILYEGLKKRPVLSPTFLALSAEYQQIILEGLKTKFNMGQFIQSENLPANLLPLQGIDPKSLNFYMLHVFYDIAGAAGHNVSNGSIIITENYWKNFKLANNAINSLICKNETALNAYNTYLIERAKMIKLDCVSKEDFAIVKICNLIRIYSPTDAKEVKQSYINLPVQVKEMLTKELTKDGISNKGILLYYAPASLSNAVNFFKKTGSIKAIDDAIKIVLPIFANVYGLAKAKINKNENEIGVCTVFIADIAEKAKKPLELKNYKFVFKGVNSDYNVKCELLEKINVKITDKSIVSGSNVVAVAIGGGSDIIQATMVGKILLKGCKNVISIRTEKTESQNEKGEMNEERKISNPKEILEDGVYLCNEETNGEGRFFENVPSEIGINSYLIIDKEDGKLFSKIQTVIEHISKNIDDAIDTILGVDTGGDCLYPIEKDETNAETTPDQDRRGLEAIVQFEKLGFKVFNCIVAPGIDSPNGITTEILTKANAVAYLPTLSESEKILELYCKWNMTGNDAKKFGKTSLIWQSALKKKRGLVTVNIPLKCVLSEKNPWIPTVTITDISEMIIFMKTSDCIKAISMFE